jgi:excisionase family DNA binding protein
MAVEAPITEAIDATDSAGRMTIPEIAARLSIGRLAVYEMLEKGIMPGIRLGRRWIVTRHAYGLWERTCGVKG